MCSPSCVGLRPEDVVHDRVVTDEAYIPIPFPEHLIDPQEWVHALATLTVCAMPKPTKLCDENGYDVIPILMIANKQMEEPLQEEFYDLNVELFLGDTVSIKDVTSSDYDTADDGDERRLLNSFDGYDSDDAIVSEEELEKIRVLLRGRDEVALEIPKTKPKRKFCKSHRKFRKQAVAEAKKIKAVEEDVDRQHFIPPVIPPEFQGKNEFLYYVGAEDSVKEDIRWKHGFQLVQNLNKNENTNPKKKRNRKPRVKKTDSI